MVRERGVDDRLLSCDPNSQEDIESSDTSGSDVMREGVASRSRKWGKEDIEIYYFVSHCNT